VNDLRLANTIHNIRITNEYRLKLYADSDRISQVLINLLTNAIKYSPDRDTVDVRIFRDGDFAAASVHDTGIGISKKD
jgi:signal transduction histidine kinase